MSGQSRSNTSDLVAYATPIQKAIDGDLDLPFESDDTTQARPCGTLATPVP